MTVQRQRPAGERRRSVVYCILTRPVDTHGIPIPGAAPEVGYIGQSRQTAWQREQQHRANQPFADLIVGGSFVLDEGQWDDATLDAREQWWIRHGASVVPDGPRQRPRYNHDHNLANPARIEIFRAQQHRRTRQPGWTPQQHRVPRQRSPHRVRPIVQQPSRSRSLLRRWWLRRRALIAAWSAVWLALFAGTWLAAGEAWPGWAGPRNAAVSATLASLGLLWLHQGRKPKRRRRRRR